MKALLEKIRKILRDRRTRKFLTRLVSGVAAVVVFITTYALVLPAITMESQAACGIEAHQHDDSCYTEELICGQEESEGHHHTEDCYTVTKDLVCSLEEHQHSAENGCYDEDGNLICKLEEHTHTDSCYEEHRELTCGLEETDGHHHTDSCYKKVLTCGKPVHTHSAACYKADPEIQSAAVASTGMTSAAAVSDLSEEEYAQEESHDESIGSQAFDEPEEIGAEDQNPGEETIDEGSSSAETEDNQDADVKDENADKEISDEGISQAETENDPVADLENNPATDLENENADDNSVAAESDDMNRNDDSESKDEKDEKADAFETGDTAFEESADEENLNTEDEDNDNNADREGEESASSFSTGFAAEEDEDSFIPEKEALDFNTVLNNKTGIYYHHLEAGETVEDSSAITDWTRVDEDTELSPEDLIRVYLGYTLPADAINATNDIARYRLPDTLHLTDEQIDAINKCENGISSQYVDYSKLEITDIERHAAYLGLESVEGTRTPDEELKEDSQEFISATVKAEKIYDEDNGEYKGTDLIFTFSPYTVEKNAHAYDKEGQPTKAGEKVKGWLMLDFNLGQVDWEEDRTSEIVFAKEDEESHISEIRTILRQANPSEDESDDSAAYGMTEAAAEYATEEIASEYSTEEIVAEDMTAEASVADATADAATVDATEEVAAADNTSVKAGEASTNGATTETAKNLSDDKTAQEKQTAASYPAAVFDDSITVRSGRLDTDLADTDLPRKTKMTVHVEADEGTFPEGSKMVLSPVDDLDAVAEAVGTAVDAKTRGFQAVDITFYDKDPSEEGAKEIEPLKPIRVSIKSDEIRKAAEDSSTAPVVVHIEDDNTATEIENTASKTDSAAIEIEKPGSEEGSIPSEIKTTEDNSAVQEKANDRDNNTTDTDVVEDTADAELREDQIRENQNEETNDAVPDKNTSDTGEVSSAPEKNNDAVDQDLKDPLMDKVDTEADNASLEQDNVAADPNEESTSAATVVETNDTLTGGNGSTENNSRNEGNTNIDDANDAVHFEADSFSVYAVVYTVDFHWEVNGKMYEFSMPGGGFVSFEHLVEVLGIAGDTNIAVTENRNETEADDSDDAAETQGVVTQNETDEEENQDNSASLSFEDVEISENTRKFVEDVESITFSSPELLSVSKVEEDTTVKDIIDELKLEIIYSQELGWNQIEKIRALEVKAGDWALIALKPFQTNETLTITMKNGEEFVISVTDYAQYSPVENDGVNIPNPNGTVMNLFDYWVDKDLKDNTGKNAWPGYSNGMYNPASWGNNQVAGYGNNRGINSWSEDTAHGHALKFNPSDQYTVFDGTYSNWQQRNVNGQRRINSWVGNADPLQGLVLPELVNGYPKLTNNSSLGTNGESLAYLFDGTEGEDMGKKVYSGVDGLLYVDQDGYYTYDSRDFAAKYNSGTNRFALSRFADNVSGGPRGFWPFGSEKFWVGLHMKVDFSMPTNGQVLNPNGEYKDMTFSFSGDDDTWIYVDGILVGDGGGVHNRTQIDINFRTGTVYVTGKNDPDYTGSFESTQYLDDLMGAYNNDGTYDTEKWEPYLDANGNQVLHTSGSNNGRPVLVFKSGSHHDLQMFYMERGGGFSNLMIHYNLISTTDMSAHKSYHNTDGSRLHRNDYRFELIGYDNTAYSGEAAKAIMPDSKIYDSTKERGTFENPEQYHVAASEGQPGYSYVKLGATEDGNVNFGNLREFSVADLGKEYRYVVREWVPPTAENEDHIQWQNATNEQKAEGGFVYGGITYDSRIYYFIGRVEETEEGSGVYELKKYRYLDPDYTIPDTETKFFSFVNGKELPLTLRINKQDDEDNPLSGAKFSLTRALQEEGKWVRRHWTDTTGAEPEEKYSELRNATTVQGALTFNNLKEGHYILEETEPPAGYEKGNVYRWLLTLTKEDSATEIVLVPTIQALDADGNVIDTVPVEELEVENHTAEFDVLNTPVPPFTITVNKSWLGANNEPLEQSEFSEYTAKFKLHRLRTYTTPGNVVTGDEITLSVGHVDNDGTWATSGRQTYKYLRGQQITINYDYHGQTSNRNKRQYRYSTNGSNWSFSVNLDNTGSFNVTIPSSGIYYIDFYDSRNVVTWTITDNGSDGETVIDQLDPVFEQNYSNNNNNIVTLTDGTISGTFNPGSYGSTADANKFPASEMIGGVLYTYKYYIEEVEPKQGGFETIYVDSAGNVVSESNLPSLASASGQQTIINRKLMDIPVEKTWPDYEDDEFTWTAKFQLDYRNVPLEGDSGDEEETGNAYDPSGDWVEGQEASWDVYEPNQFAEISKGDTVQKYFEDLPMYYTDGDGVTWRREYSVREVEYSVWRVDEHGTKVEPPVVSKGTNGSTGYEYTLWYRQDAGEDYDDNGIIDENDYVISVENLLAHREVKRKINISIDKAWPAGTNYATSPDARAVFRLKRYVVEEYRNYEGINTDQWVDITLDTGDGNNQTLRVPQGQGMYIRGYLKGGTSDQNITFTCSAGSAIPPYSDDNSSNPDQKAFSIGFTADVSKNIVLTDGADDVSGGIYGFHLSDAGSLLVAKEDTHFSREFELNSSNNWHADFTDLPFVEVVQMNEGSTATTYVYSYYFEEVECVPESFYPTFTDSNRQVLLGDEDNRIIFTTDITASNRPTGFDILKVDKTDTSRKLPGAEFELRKLSEDDDLHYPIATNNGTFAGTLIETSETAQETGLLTFDELLPGYYEVSETKAPAGYVILADSSFYIKVEKTGDILLLKKQVQGDTVILVEASAGEMVGNASITSSKSTDGKTITLTVCNEPGAALPNTGGPGTSLSYLFGIMLTGLAGAGLVMKKRRRNAA